MKRGQLKSYIAFSKNGFVQDLSSQQEYYVAEADMEEGIKEGDSVVFEVKDSKYGLMAINVKKTKDAGKG